MEIKGRDSTFHSINIEINLEFYFFTTRATSRVLYNLILREQEKKNCYSFSKKKRILFSCTPSASKGPTLWSMETLIVLLNEAMIAKSYSDPRILYERNCYTLPVYCNCNAINKLHKNKN